MSYDIEAIRAGLANALKPLVDSGVLLKASPYSTASPNPPAAMVAVGPATFDDAGANSDTLTMTVSLVVDTASSESAQRKLDGMLGRGPNSVKVLLEADETLGGACDGLHVTAVSGQRIYALDTAQGGATAPVLGCEWTVEVLT